MGRRCALGGLRANRDALCQGVCGGEAAGVLPAGRGGRGAAERACSALAVRSALRALGLDPTPRSRKRRTEVDRFGKKVDRVEENDYIGVRWPRRHRGAGVGPGSVESPKRLRNCLNLTKDTPDILLQDFPRGRNTALIHPFETAVRMQDISLLLTERRNGAIRIP